MSEVKPPALFDWLNSINTTKADLMVDEVTEKAFDPFIIRRGIAQSMDTIMLAQEMNKRHALPKRLQYDFFLLGVTKKKRYAKWSKKVAAADDVKTISEYYGVSYKEAEEYAKLLSEEKIAQLVARMDTGGRKK